MSGDKPDMKLSGFSPMSDNAQISLPELKRLLIDIIESRADVSVRFRLIGEMWQMNHYRIITITEPGVILQNESEARPFAVPDINNVIQFELDRNFRQYQPHFHYSVIR